MRKLVLSMTVLAMAVAASADLYVPNGQFETADGAEWVGNFNSVDMLYPTTGGNGGGYASK